MSNVVQKTVGAFARLTELGTQGHASDVVRRLRIVNLAALSGSLTALGYAIFYASYDYDTLALVVYINIAAAASCPVVPLLHRLGRIAGGLIFSLALCLFLFAFTYLLGRETGIPLYFLLSPAVALLFFGTEHIRLVAALAVIGTGLYLAAYFLFPAENAAIAIDQSLLDAIYIFSAATFGAILLSIVFYAFHQLARAEAAAEREYKRSERLLRNILPEPIAARLKERPDAVIADNLSEVTVLFADIVDFTPRASSLPPENVVSLLNRVFTEFDGLADWYGLEKIKTIGDAYMIAGGLPTHHEDHAATVANMALDMLAATRGLGDDARGAVDIRIGIHSGPVVAGVIGTRKFSYDIWGDTVNTAARLESHGMPGRIHVSSQTYGLLKDRFMFEARGVVDVKGKGPLSTYFLTGRRGEIAQPAIGSLSTL